MVFKHLRAAAIAFTSIATLLGSSGCVSEAQHDELARELRRSQFESAQRANEITNLRQMLYYYGSSPKLDPTNQAAMMQLARAYNELVVRYGALLSDLEALRRCESEHRAFDEALQSRLPVSTSPQRGAPPSSSTSRPSPRSPADPFLDRY
jgi:hypothetical protein